MYINVDEKLIRLAREPTELNYGEILLLSLIKSMSADEFFMSNEAIANLMCTSVRSVKRWLSNLSKHKLIEVYYDTISGKEKRVIKCQI